LRTKKFLITALSTSAFVSVTTISTSPVFATPVQHRDTEELRVSSAFGVFGGRWSVMSDLNFLSAEPHTTPVEGITAFNSLNIFTAGADSFQPLFVPGIPIGFVPRAAESLADRNYEIDLTLSGPGIFDYSQPWRIQVEDNRKLPSVEYTFSADIRPMLTVGPIGGSLGGFGVSVTYRPPQLGGVLFAQRALPQDFNIILTTTEASEQGFFASGGRIVIDGFVKDTAPGTTRLLYDNIHFATGEGILVDDFTMALGAGFVRTEVYDETTSVAVPEPSSTSVFLAFGTLGAASVLNHKRKLSRSTNKGTEEVS
jgi:hypothetical protein